jgi:DNA-directed RNA polymerase specialized sigma24 family protein
MPQLRSISAGPSRYEDILLKLHGKLLKFALCLANHDRAQAEDLVHDAFVQFVLSCDPAKIQNVEAYLCAILRNLHVGRMRHASQFRTEELSVVDWDSAALGLRTANDSRLRLQVHQQLQQVCRYACLRKQTSLAGSVLILRFFHGYYPVEIALLTQSSRNNVEQRLVAARREVRLYLEDPSKVDSLQGSTTVESTVVSTRQRKPEDDPFILDLRDMIFSAQSGKCPSHDELRFFYSSSKKGHSVSTSLLAHLVSCADCLDRANRILGLPLLADRYPTDSLGPDHSDDDSGDPDLPIGQDGTSGPTRAKAKETVRRHRRQITQVIRHDPKELRVTVNGFVLGSHQVNGSVNKLSLTFNGDEKMGFIEVLSEQGVLLMLMNVEAPPTGELDQSAVVNLSEGRTLELTVSYKNPWPGIHLVYRDPRPAVAPVPLRKSALDTKKPTGFPSPDTSPREISPLTLLDFPSSRRLGKFWRWIPWLPLWRHPGLAAVSLGLIALVAASVIYKRTLAPTASDLLRRSSVTERSLAAEQVVHRTIALEEKSASGQVISRKKVDVWRSGKLGKTGRRLYDQQNHLTAGDWTQADGSSTIYQKGSSSRLNRGQQGRFSLNFDDAWQFEPSAEQFSQLVARVNEPTTSPSLETTTVTQGASTYVLDYTRGGAGNQAGLLRAELVLDRADLRATEQTFVLREKDETREFRFVETSFEQRPLREVAPAVFEPDPLLIGGELFRSAPDSPIRASRSFATTQLEIETLRLLSQIGADMNDQIDVNRTRRKKLRVNGILESAERKNEVLRVLAPVLSNPAIEVRLNTVTEALAALENQSKPAHEPVRLESLTPPSEKILADSDLRRYFSGQGVPTSQLDGEITQAASEILNRSFRALKHARAIQRVTIRFSARELSALPVESKVEWLQIIEGHARSLEEELKRERAELEPILGAPASSDSTSTASAEITDLGQLVTVARRLGELCSTSDRAAGAMFALSPPSAAKLEASPQSNQELDSDSVTARLWQSLAEAEGLALQIHSTAQHLSLAATK